MLKLRSTSTLAGGTANDDNAVDANVDMVDSKLRQHKTRSGFEIGAGSLQILMNFVATPAAFEASQMATSAWQNLYSALYAALGPAGIQQKRISLRAVHHPCVS